MSAIIKAILASLTPVGELRAGIPLAITLGMSPFAAFFVCVVANILVIPLTYLFLGVIHTKLIHSTTYSRIFDKLLHRIRRKSSRYVEKWGILGLLFLVAIPLPGTGAYTATIAAWLFGIEKKKAFISITLGLILAGILVTILFVTGSALFRSATSL